MCGGGCKNDRRNQPEEGHVESSVGVVDTVGVAVGDVGNSWGS